MLYIAIAKAQPIIPWDETMRGIHTEPLSSHDEGVAAQFRHPYVAPSARTLTVGAAFATAPAELELRGDRLMTDAQVISWIMLSIAEQGSTRRQIAEMADGINHAVPTHREMETSLRWLKDRGFVVEEGGRFAPAKSGASLMADLQAPSRPISEMWRLLENSIQALLHK